MKRKTIGQALGMTNYALVFSAFTILAFATANQGKCHLRNHILIICGIIFQSNRKKLRINRVFPVTLYTPRVFRFKYYFSYKYALRMNIIIHMYRKTNIPISLVLSSTS